MSNSGDVVRHVRCPRCHGLLQEPAGVPVYQCGGCGATLRAKNRSGVAPSTTSGGLPPTSGATTSSRSITPDARDVASSSRGSSSTPDAVKASRRRQETSSRSITPEDGKQHARKDASGEDVASTPPPDATTSSGDRRRATGAARRRPDQSAGDLVAPAPTEKQKKEHDDRSPTTTTTSRGGARESSAELRRRRGTTDDAERNSAATSPSQQVLAPRSPAQAAAEPQQQQPPSSRDGGTNKVPMTMNPPPRQAGQDLAPLRQKILKTVDELKGDLSELFSKSPELNPSTTRATRRPPHLLPKQQQGEGAAVDSTLPAARARHADAPVHGNEDRAAAKPSRVVAAPPRRGLPSRRYRRCRADPCCENAQPIRTSCQQHHGCCCRHHHHQGKPECSSCRGHCGRPSKAREWKPPAPAAAPNKRRPPPRHHCRPVLKGAPFIICSTCFQLVQVPAGLAVATGRLCKLRCGACSTVLSYSYTDPGRKKPHHQDLSDSIDQLSQCTDPFAPFVDDFGLSSYSTTEDEQPPLHVSRNTSFDSVVNQGVGRLHRLLGYGSASELLRPHSPDLYESGFDDDYRTTPDYDRKGKAVCIDAEDDDSDDDDEDSSVVVRSAAKAAVWPMPGTLGREQSGSSRS